MSLTRCYLALELFADSRPGVSTFVTFGGIFFVGLVLHFGSGFFCLNWLFFWGGFRVFFIIIKTAKDVTLSVLQSCAWLLPLSAMEKKGIFTGRLVVFPVSFCFLGCCFS